MELQKGQRVIVKTDICETAESVGVVEEMVAMAGMELTINKRCHFISSEIYSVNENNYTWDIKWLVVVKANKGRISSSSNDKK